MSGNGKLNLEKEIEKILATPLHKPGEFILEEEHSGHHFIDAKNKKYIECIINLPTTTKEEVILLEMIDCDKKIHTTKNIHELLNWFFEKGLLPHEILAKVDSIFNMECYGTNKEKLLKKFDVINLCSYARKYKEAKTGIEKLGDVRKILIKKIGGNFKTKEILEDFGIKTEDVKKFLENYFIYRDGESDWRDFSEQWEIIARNRDKVVSQNNENKKNKKNRKLREHNLFKRNSTI